MIRGPVLPNMRDSLWSLVSSRLDRIETGMTLVHEGLDCGDGQLGLVEGLARDAMGAPVLVLLAVDGDGLLPARALAAGKFLQRVGDALVEAVPEANFRPGAVGRVMLIGTEASARQLQQVASLPVPRLQACALEPFRVAGSERFAVRWLSDAAESVADDDQGIDAQPALAFTVPDARRELWDQLVSICDRIDDAIVMSGDRYQRRISWNGNLLGTVRIDGDALIAASEAGLTLELKEPRDVRRFGDQVLRAVLRHAGVDLATVQANEQSSGSTRLDAASLNGESVDSRTSATRYAESDRMPASNGESLRSSLAAARLSPEEYSALEDPASVAGGVRGGTVVAEDREQTSSSGTQSPSRD